MDVHPPHEPIHTVKDFLLHILTITIGLLIALGLEAAVETMHHRHLLHTAEANLRLELLSNLELIRKDREGIAASQRRLAEQIALIRAVRAHRQESGDIDVRWGWSGPDAAAWNTARDTGALALMSYDRAQNLSMVYEQQRLVGQQAIVYIRDVNLSAAALAVGEKLTALSDQQLDQMLAATQQTLADLKLLDDLSRPLEQMYQSALNE